MNDIEPAVSAHISSADRDLFRALIERSVPRTLKALAQGADPNGVVEEGYPMLAVAMFADDPRDPDRQTPTTKKARYIRRLNCVEALLDAGANPRTLWTSTSMESPETLFWHLASDVGVAGCIVDWAPQARMLEHLEHWLRRGADPAVRREPEAPRASLATLEQEDVEHESALLSFLDLHLYFFDNDEHVEERQDAAAWLTQYTALLVAYGYPEDAVLARQPATAPGRSGTHLLTHLAQSIAQDGGSTLEEAVDAGLAKRQAMNLDNTLERSLSGGRRPRL